VQDRETANRLLDPNIVAKVTRSSAHTLRLGLVAAPDLPEKVAHELCDELPGLLSRHIDDSVSWEVSVVVDPLTGSELDAPELLDVCRDRMLKEGWDMAICLTDLPVYRSGRLVVADVSAVRAVAGISLPALGATRVRARAREAVLQLVAELYARNPTLGLEDTSSDGEKAHAGASTHPGPGPRRLVNGRLAEVVAPLQRLEPPDDDMKDMNVDARFVATRFGHLRLLAGMVLANRPWKILPSFKSALAAAFATGAYVLVTYTMWMLADVAGWARLLVLMTTSIVAMVPWVIVAHHLWERPTAKEARHWTVLYNGVTVLTMTVAVLCAYAVLFALVLLAAAIFVPSGYFQSTLQRPVGPGEYATLAWFATSLATVAGALGSSLEHEDTVRKAAYGYRQRRRYEQFEGSEDDSE
jgi:hypothetical protein